MGTMVNTTGNAINTNGTMPITTVNLMRGGIITGIVKAVAIVMFHMRSLMSRRDWSSVHIMGHQVLRP